MNADRIHTMKPDDVHEAPRPSLRILRRVLTVPLIIAVLYAPQSWFFLMDYPWNCYWHSWLKFFPGLPAFMPVAIWAHPNDTLMMMATMGTTMLVAVGLFGLRMRWPLLFKIALVIVCAWSMVSAFSAYGVFRA